MFKFSYLENVLFISGLIKGSNIAKFEEGYVVAQGIELFKAQKTELLTSTFLTPVGLRKPVHMKE